MDGRTVAVGVDHAGFPLKRPLVERLERSGRAVLDLGADGTGPVDYPDYAFAVARALRDGEAEFGVLVCGAGVGMSIAANRYPWVRAALCHDAAAARLARAHNDANVLALGARVVPVETALECLAAFLEAGFEGGRHARRVGKLAAPPRLRGRDAA